MASKNAGYKISIDGKEYRLQKAVAELIEAMRLDLVKCETAARELLRHVDGACEAVHDENCSYSKQMGCDCGLVTAITGLELYLLFGVKYNKEEK